MNKNIYKRPTLFKGFTMAQELLNLRHILIKTLNDERCDMDLRCKFQQQYFEVCKRLRDLISTK